MDKVSLINTILSMGNPMGIIYLADYNKVGTALNELSMELKYANEFFLKQSNTKISEIDRKNLKNFNNLLVKINNHIIEYEIIAQKERNVLLLNCIKSLNLDLKIFINQNLKILYTNNTSLNDAIISINKVQNNILEYQNSNKGFFSNIFNKTKHLKNVDTHSLSIVKKVSNERLYNLDTINKPGLPDFTFSDNSNYVKFYENQYNYLKDNYTDLPPNIEVKSGNTADQSLPAIRLFNTFSEAFNNSNKNLYNDSTKVLLETYANNKPKGAYNIYANMKRCWNADLVLFDYWWSEVAPYKRDLFYAKTLLIVQFVIEYYMVHYGYDIWSEPNNLGINPETLKDSLFMFNATYTPDNMINASDVVNSRLIEDNTINNNIRQINNLENINRNIVQPKQYSEYPIRHNTINKNYIQVNVIKSSLLDSLKFNNKFNDYNGDR